MTLHTSKLGIAPSRSRLQSLAASSVPVQSNRTAGKFGAGLLTNVSAVTAGEALGHGFWIDAVFLGQIAAALTAVDGTKSRFTHPGLSADGLAKGLGLAMGGRVEGNQVLTDVHFYESAHITPDGDLANYVLTRADEDPLHFGTSIVFYDDEQAEADFLLANGATAVIEEDEYGTYEVFTGFKSPDPLNVDNLPHCRLKEFCAVDFVDDPAANPGGLFHRDLSTINTAESFLDYALGLSDTKPEGLAFDIDPERARLFFTRYAAQRQLNLPKKGNPMVKILKKGKLSSDPASEVPGTPATTTTDDMAAADTPGAVTCPECGAVFVPDSSPDPISDQPQSPADYAANHAAYVQAFGSENGSKWFFGKKKFADAQKLHFEAQLAAKDGQITTLQSQLVEANRKLAAVAKEGTTALTASPPPTGTEEQAKGKSGFAGLFKVKP